MILCFLQKLSISWYQLVNNYFCREPWCSFFIFIILFIFFTESHAAQFFLSLPRSQLQTLGLTHSEIKPPLLDFLFKIETGNCRFCHWFLLVKSTNMEKWLFLGETPNYSTCPPRQRPCPPPLSATSPPPPPWWLARGGRGGLSLSTPSILWFPALSPRQQRMRRGEICQMAKNVLNSQW